MSARAPASNRPVRSVPRTSKVERRCGLRQGSHPIDARMRSCTRRSFARRARRHVRRFCRHGPRQRKRTASSPAPSAPALWSYALPSGVKADSRVEIPCRWFRRDHGLIGQNVDLTGAVFCKTDDAAVEPKQLCVRPQLAALTAWLGNEDLSGRLLEGGAPIGDDQAVLQLRDGFATIHSSSGDRAANSGYAEFGVGV